MIVKNISLSKMRYFMLGINIMASLFVMFVIYMTSETVCRFEKATDFINSVERLPANPSISFIYTLIICASFLMTFVIRQLMFPQKKSIVYATLGIDLFLNSILLRVIDCNYDGFILWLIANVIYHVESNWKYPAMIAGIFTYMFFSYDLVNVYYPLFSVRSYILFYSRNMQHVLFFVFYTLTTLNLISFIVFCIQVIREQKDIIDEINRLYNQLRKANDELREYADIKEKMGQTRERNRIAMEIHDTLGHSLTGISVGVDTCIAIMDKNPAIAKAQLQVISGVAKNGISDIRRSVSTLQPDRLNHTTLEQNIRDMISKTEKATGIYIGFFSHIQLHFEEDEENAIFRIIQESVTNAIRHGEATKIEIVISKESDNLEIIISDNGRGCESFTEGFGITHMKERINLLHGSIDFISHNGFTVKAVIPLRGESEE